MGAAAQEALEQLADELRSYIAESAGKADFLVDHNLISEQVDLFSHLYRGTQLAALQSQGRTWAELRDLIPRVIQLITDDRNYPEILVALGAPANLSLSPKVSDIQAAVDRHHTIIVGLQVIEAAAPQPTKRSRGRPVETADLHFLLYWIAEFWESQTGQEFRPHWFQKQPTNNEAKFTLAIVTFIDANRISQLAEVCKTFRTARLAGDRDAAWRGFVQPKVEN